MNATQFCRERTRRKIYYVESYRDRSLKILSGTDQYEYVLSRSLSTEKKTCQEAFRQRKICNRLVRDGSRHNILLLSGAFPTIFFFF